MQKLFLLSALLVAAPVAAQGGEEPAPAAKPKVICKRTPETGSLVQGKKQCFTRAEWDKMAQANRNGAQRMIDDLNTRPGGQ